MTGTPLAAALDDLLFFSKLDLDEALDRHFTPDYRQRTDGVWSDRAEFRAHIAHLRAVVVGGSIHVHEELREGSRYAERHAVDLSKADGSTARLEVYVFGDVDPDGRFRRIEEVTHMVTGHETDRVLGNAR